MINFSAWSIHRPLPAILLFILLMGAGFHAFERLPITDFADIAFPNVSVTVTYSGATPAQMEAEVTRKVEDAVAGVTGVQHITSTVTQGSSVTNVEFDLDYDVHVALADVRDAVTRIRASLPQDINEPTVSRVTLAGEPVATYAIESTSIGEAELSWLVDDSLAKLLRSISGVGAVERIGGVNREIRVDLKPDRLLAYGITAGQISQQLRNSQGEQTGGTIKLGAGQQDIRVLATVGSADELRVFPIALSDGRSVRLDELGSVEDRFEDRSSLTLLNGKDVVGMQVRRAQAANELEIATAVTQKLQEFAASHPTVKFTLVSSNAPFVRAMFDTSMTALYEGAILAIIVVFIFLRDWRATWISAIALPLSIVPTFYVMSMFNVGLNTLSLLALSLVVGLLVDDAIVEVENIVRHLRDGKTPKQAALDAAQEIGLAVIGTSLTLCAVFLPVGFLTGVIGRFFKQFAITCIVAVLFSLLVARLITPMMAAYQLKPKADHETRGPLFHKYLKLVEWTLHNRGKTLLAAFSTFVLAIAGYLMLPSSFLNADDRGELNINITLPPGADLETTRRAAAQVEQMLKSQPEVIHVFSNLKIGSATVIAKLTDFEERERTQQQMQSDLTPAFSYVTAARVTFGGGGFGQNLAVTLAGDDPVKLEDTAARVENELRSIGIAGASSSASLLKPEITVRPDFAKIAELGITSTDISEAIRIGTSGDISTRLPKLSLPSRQVPIRVQLDQDALKSIDTLRLLRIPAGEGSVPLGSISAIELSSGPAEISRYDRLRYISINVPLNGQAISEVANRVFALPALKQLPAGIERQESGDLERQRELNTGFMLAMLTGVFCVYGVLALLFNDLVQPITILMALPLSIGGAVAALSIGGYPLALASFIGLLMLMGIAVKNSILLVDYAILGEERGLSRNEALIDACAKRARPIIMTSIAMGAGMLPSALNLEGNSGFRAPMGMAVLGGLFTSTILSLMVIPAAYTYMSDFESWIRRRWHKVNKHGAATSAGG